jgi:hypothetical protein
MDMKKFRHFICGVCCGAAGIYWYTSAAEETFEKVLSWLENAADEYRASNPVPEVNTGWQQKKKETKNRL